MKRFRNSDGYTMLEVIVAMALTGILAMSGFEFYAAIHSQTSTQEEISEMQQNSRATLAELVRTMRKAGYKIGGHRAYEISGDSLWIFFSETQPVDTVLYYLSTDADYQQGIFREEGAMTRKFLMKKVNSGYPVVYSEMIENISYNVIKASIIEISVEVIARKADENYQENGGYRTRTVAETISLRNDYY